MRIYSLGIRTGLLSVAVPLLVLAACGTNSLSNNRTNICGGCAFVYATTNPDEILTLAIDSSGRLASPTLTSGPANGPDILGTGFMPQPPYGGPLYVSDPNENAIDAFAVNASDGTFTMMPGSPFALGGLAGSPAGLVVFGNYLYAGDTNGKVAAFSIGSSGSLTMLPGSPFAAGAEPLHLISAYTGSPSIPLLYAADVSGSEIWGFSIRSNGALTEVPGSPFATPPNSAPSGMFAGGNAISGGILYIALGGLSQIAAFSIDGTGALTPILGSPFSAGEGPASLLGFGSFLYAMNTVAHTISAYSMDQNTGILTQIQGSPFPAGTASGGFVVNPRILSDFYVPDLQSNSVLGFTADTATDQLSALPGSPYATGVGPVALTTVAFPVSDPP